MVDMIHREEIIGDARLLLGDCRDILPTILTVDAIVTDPPYGIGFGYESHDDNEADWYSLIDSSLPLMRRAAEVIVMPNCRMMSFGWWFENHRPDWVIAWYKGSPGHASKVGFNDWEPHLVWGRPAAPIHDYFQTPLQTEPNGHPCPKPLGWAMWLASRFCPPYGVLCDPFMGSGTTGVACANLGRKFIGIEIEPKYFDIACRRIERAYAQPRLFKDEPIISKQEVMDL